MSISEADAKTKACFQAQTFAGSQQVADGPGPHCIASDCMAWRWSRAKETEAYLAAVQAHMKEHGVNFNVATQKVYAEIGSTFEQVEGFCGLAGKVTA